MSKKPTAPPDAVCEVCGLAESAAMHDFNVFANTGRGHTFAPVPPAPVKMTGADVLGSSLRIADASEIAPPAPCPACTGTADYHVHDAPPAPECPKCGNIYLTAKGECGLHPPAPGCGCDCPKHGKGCACPCAVHDAPPAPDRCPLCSCVIGREHAPSCVYGVALKSATRMSDEEFGWLTLTAEEHQRGVALTNDAIHALWMEARRARESEGVAWGRAATHGVMLRAKDAEIAVLKECLFQMQGAASEQTARADKAEADNARLRGFIQSVADGTWRGVLKELARVALEGK